MAKILFTIHTSTVFVESYRLAVLLKRQSIESVFLFAYDHWTVETYSKSCIDAGLQVFTARSDDGVMGKLLGKVSRKLPISRRSAMSVVIGFFSEFVSLLLSLRRARAAFNAIKPDLLVLSIDLAGYDAGAYEKMARRRHCRVLLISSIMSIGLDQAEVYYNDKSYHVRGALRWLIARLFPKWVLLHRAREIFRVPPGRVLAMELLRLSPPKPWLFNSSHADVINMESEAMRDYYGQAGMPVAQMVVTGSTSDDVMWSVRTKASTKRAELCRSLNLTENWPILLTALPPNFLDLPGGRPECDFRDYEALVDFWLASCASVSKCNVVVALHPSVPFAEAPKFERYGARVSTLNTAELVPLCDVFVASISSTIRWAIACGVPVVNYDVYRYRYTDFTGVEGVLNLEEKTDFAAMLQKLLCDEEFASHVREKQRAVASAWGRLDGLSGARMVDLVNSLLPATAQPAIDRVGPRDR